MRGLAAWSNAPSPLEGEGWGGGMQRHGTGGVITPPPGPLPQGEGEEEGQGLT